MFDVITSSTHFVNKRDFLKHLNPATTPLLQARCQPFKIPTIPPYKNRLSDIIYELTKATHEKERRPNYEKKKRPYSFIFRHLENFYLINKPILIGTEIREIQLPTSP
jgi:hypothetical protein